MATVTKNPPAGEYALDSVPDVLVSVPKQCVGKRRCPLFIFLPGLGIPARELTNWMRPVADKYGMILLAPTRYEPPVIDAALKETLRRFAIDPNKIAIIGRCHSGTAGLRFGIENLDVFSRIVSVSGGIPAITGMDPKNKTAEFLFDEGILEARGDMIKAAQVLRRDGHPVTVAVTLRGHEHQTEDYDFVGHWLRDSWTTHDPAAHPVPAVVTKLRPVLTTETLARMTDFWTRFAKEPDSIRVTARRARLREVSVPVGDEQASTWIVDMHALAAAYPPVAADLRAARLTARQHDAYRVALIAAYLADKSWQTIANVKPGSALARSVEFLQTHRDEFQALSQTGIVETNVDKVTVTDSETRAALRAIGWDPDNLRNGALPTPAIADSMGPRGIWRTP